MTQMINIHNTKEVKKFEDELSQCRSYCVCGHSIIFQVQTKSIICTHCGRTAYNNSLARFKKIMKEISKNDDNTNYITNN